MKPFLLSMIILFTLPLGSPFAETFSNEVAAYNQDLMKVAKEETKRRFPMAQIINCQQVWESKMDTYSLVQYKLWMKELSEDFTATTSIKYNRNTGEIIEVIVIKDF